MLNLPSPLLPRGVRSRSGFSGRMQGAVAQGIQCFAFDEEAHVLVTGGPDCCVRVWNPFVPARASLVLLGHHAGVTSIVLQGHGQTIYSLSRDRVIKVWDVQGQACVQVGYYYSLFIGIFVILTNILYYKPTWEHRVNNPDSRNSYSLKPQHVQSIANLILCLDKGAHVNDSCK